MNYKILIGFAGIVVLALALVGGSASAATKRDVITDAGLICAETQHAELDAACDLVSDTNGGQDLTTTGCKGTFDGIDNGVVKYLLRNCDRNEEALLRNVSSVVLSLDDVLTRQKIEQEETAAGYACSYADKYDLLVGASKLVIMVSDPPSDPQPDLGVDASDIALALGFPCS